MPTGYTAAIAEGVTFERFALNCARAFGACIMMRDDDSSAEIPEQFEPSDYNLKSLEKDRKALDKVSRMTPKQCAAAAQKEYGEAVARRNEALKEGDELRLKYEAMLKQVQGWDPPTPDHVNMKEFMVKQIEDSIPWDCDQSYYRDNVPVLLPAEDWRQQQIKSLSKSIAQHERGHAEEVARVKGRNAWIKALRDSLKAPAKI